MDEVRGLGQKSQGQDVMETGWPVPRTPPKASLAGGSRGEQAWAWPKLSGQ